MNDKKGHSMDYNKIFERMLEASNLKKGSEIARLTGITPQAISNFRKKGEMPAGFILRFAETFNISVDWLLTGNGDKIRDRDRYLRQDGLGAVGIKALSDFKPDELIYIGKLLNILREPERCGASVVKACIDASLCLGQKQQ
jgi:transcriptional regulator with XRE-family HTH domain